MDANFPKALHLILQFEGGYVDDPKDPGGVTNLGVTMETWRMWITKPVTPADMRALTPDLVAPLYRARYWQATGCPDWPSGVDLIVFDEAVNQGPGRAVRTLQTAAHTEPDGLLGPASHAAVLAIPAPIMIEAISSDRERHYRSLPTFSHFGHGWLNRLAAVTEHALALAGAAAPPTS